VTFLMIPSGVVVFLDANTLIYHFTNHPRYGAACTQLVTRVELGGLRGLTSAHVLADVAHRLMTLEAIARKGWPQAGVAARLRKHHDEIPALTEYRQAVARIPLLGISVIPTTQLHVEQAGRLSQQHELLTGDALIVAAMQQHGLTHLASNDDDFDRFPGITRYGPV
jgi:predicted nucleic acid-binding protein